MTLLDERQLSAQGQNVMVVLEQCCQQHACRLPQAINQLACQVAQQLLSQSLSYAEGLQTMQGLLAVMTSSAAAEQLQGKMPEPAASIYLAFEAGSFQHVGDDGHMDSAQQHTLPLLQDVLAAHAAV